MIQIWGRKIKTGKSQGAWTVRQQLWSSTILGMLSHYLYSFFETILKKHSLRYALKWYAASTSCLMYDDLACSAEVESAGIVNHVWLTCRISESHGNGALRMIIPDLVIHALQFLPSSVAPVLRGTADKVTIWLIGPLLATTESKCLGIF